MEVLTDFIKGLEDAFKTGLETVVKNGADVPAAVKTVNDAVKTGKESIEKEFQSLKTASETAVKTASDLQLELDASKTSITDLTKKNSSLESEKTTLEAEKNSLSEEIETLKGEVSTANEANKTLEDANQALSIETKQLQVKIDENKSTPEIETETFGAAAIEAGAKMLAEMEEK